MTEKIKLSRYSFEFLKHLNTFILRANLFSAKQRPVIALSGGVDSVALAYSILLSVRNGICVTNKLPRFIHIDHGTRPEIKKEMISLKKWAAELGVEFSSVDLDLSLSDGNFEMKARSQRYKSFNSFLKEDEILLTGHHLDDSFEWTMMQSLKSSSLSGSLGIPVKGPRVVRPFLCLSKAQITRFAKDNGLMWFEDESNNDLDFERNYIRKLIKDNIAVKYPKYLKHYARRQNTLADKLGLSVFKNESTKLDIKKRDWGHIVKVEGSLNEHCLELSMLITKSSSKGRGRISDQYIKLVASYNKSNGEYRGPLSFSGGVKVYYSRPYVIIVSKGKSPHLYSSSSQIPDCVPFIKKANKKTSLKSAISIAEKKTQALLDEGVHFQLAWRNAHGQILYWF